MATSSRGGKTSQHSPTKYTFGMKDGEKVTLDEGDDGYHTIDTGKKRKS